MEARGNTCSPLFSLLRLMIKGSSELVCSQSLVVERRSTVAKPVLYKNGQREAEPTEVSASPAIARSMKRGASVIRPASLQENAAQD